MRILAIETSCDETALALLDASGGLRAPKFKVIENLVASQIKIHRPFGGVVPNLAKREHIKNLPILLKKLAMDYSKLKSRNKNSKLYPIPYTLNAIDMIAVTVGPGLEPALWTGITFAEELAKKYKKPLVGANHLEGHLYSFLLPQKTNQRPTTNNTKMFPAIALIVSGGHTILLKLTSLSKWKKLGETRDDAAGECFDKIARLLALPYPGGPEVEKVAKRGDPLSIPFPRPMVNQKNYEFSFSGLKTSVLYYLRDHTPTNNKSKTNLRITNTLYPIPYTLAADIAASAQEAIVETLVKKTIRATKEFRAKSIILCGGVAANSYLKSIMGKATSDMGISFFVPDFAYNTDNAVMIAAAGYMAHLRKKRFKMVANGNLGI